MDAGTIWYEALSQAGKNIGDGIKHYKEQQDQVENMDSMVQMFSQQTFPDPTGKVDPKTGQPKMVPMITPEMVNQWTAKTGAQKAHSMGAMQALIEMQMGLAHEGAKAMMSEDALIRKENLIVNRQEKVAAFRQGLKDRSAPKDTTLKPLQSLGMDPEGFDKIDLQHVRPVDSTGKVIPRTRFGKDGKLYENTGNQKEGKQWEPSDATVKTVQLPNGRNVSLEKFKSLKAQRKMNAAAGAKRQGGIPHVSSVSEAMQYPPGTVVMTPVGIKKVPGKPTQGISDESDDETGGENDADE